MTKQTEKQRLDSILASNPTVGLAEGMMRSGVDEITMDDDSITPNSKFGPGEDDLLLEEPGFTEAGVVEDNIEKRWGGFAKTGLDEK